MSSSSKSKSSSSGISSKSVEDRPAKRVKLEVHNEASGTPLLVSFPGGVPLFGLGDMEVIATRQTSSKNKAAKTKVRVVSDRLVFEGTDYGDNSSKKNCYNFAIGVVRKDDDSKMHVYPAGHAFSVRPVAKEFVAKDEAKTLTNAQRKESLTQEFGSKKKKSQVRAAKSNQISAENISGAGDLTSLVTDQTVDEAQLQSAEEIVRRSRIRQSRGKK